MFQERNIIRNRYNDKKQVEKVLKPDQKYSFDRIKIPAHVGQQFEENVSYE